MTKVRGIALVGGWTPEEKKVIPEILGPMPDAWLKDNPFISRIIRKPTLLNAPKTAPGHSKYEPQNRSIVVFDKGVYHDGKIDLEQFRRSVCHELAHAILELHPKLLSKWTIATKNDDYVDDYAKTSPEEDFADTFSEFFIDPKKTRSVVPRKANFVQKLLSLSRGGEEKIAMFNIASFADELTKTAISGSALKDMLSKAVRSPATKGVGLAGAGAGGGAIVGHEMGEGTGLKQGRKNVRTVAVQARKIGRREGVMMYHQALQKSLRSRGQQR